MYYSRLPQRARVSASYPRAFAVCDRCGFVYNHKDLVWQSQWIGPRLQNLRILVCKDCLDKPQEQLRTFIIPADPIPIYTPRPEQYDVEVPSFLSDVSAVTATLTTENGITLVAENGDILVVVYNSDVEFDNITTETGDSLILEIEDTLTPDPNNPAIYP